MIYSLKISLIFLLHFFLNVWVPTVLCASFNEYITYYEPLNYNKQHLHNEHLRRKRSLDDSLLSLVFSSHKRLFHLKLRQDSSVFKENAFYSDGRPIDLDLSHIHSGYVEGANGSYVHGSIIDGVFSGRIEFPDEIFYIEKSEMYFREPTDFHSFVYSDKNVIDNPHRTKRSSARNPGCGMAEGHVHEWMKRVQRSAVKPIHRDMPNGNDESAGWNKYSYWANRQKRSTPDDARQCSLYLQTDPTLWEFMRELKYPEGKIKTEITALLASHVDGLNAIFKNAIFGPYKGFNFVVYRLQVNSTNGCANNSMLGFCKYNLDASNFLNIHSLTNHDDYCLAYVFTYREFSQGTIGLAWVGSPSTSGGVCDRWKLYNENKGYVNKSLNTGIVTLRNYNSRVPLRISILTFSHEVGHSFGSPHDSGPTCIPLLANPSNKAGNYLMFASATSGLQTNNNQFSVCSIGNITENLNSIMGDPANARRATSCFKTRQDSFCGNGIVETDSVKNISEECDCGFQSDCLSDGCCNPRISGSDEDTAACKRIAGKECSKSEGPCCSSVPGNCTFVSQDSNMTCNQETDCTETSYCNGSSARCPPARAKKDETPCNFNTQMCKKGECTTSICEKISWRSCSIQAPVGDKSFDLGQLCYISCLNPSTNSCISTGNINDVNKPENINLKNLLVALNISKSDGSIKGIRMPAGAPCNNYRGYCDVFFKCRPVNEEGPLAQLTKLLFNEQTISEIRDWVTTYWWACLLVGVGIIIFMALFIKVCAVHTPSSNPKLKKARQLSLRRKKKQQSDMKLTVSSISSGADILRSDKSKKPRSHDSPF